MRSSRFQDKVLEEHRHGLEEECEREHKLFTSVLILESESNLNNTQSDTLEQKANDPLEVQNIRLLSDFPLLSQQEHKQKVRSLRKRKTVCYNEEKEEMEEENRIQHQHDCVKIATTSPWATNLREVIQKLRKGLNEDKNKDQKMSTSIEVVGLECSLCKYLGKNSLALETHLQQTHNRKPRYSCYTVGCDFKADNIFTINFHTSSVHQDKRKLYCLQCSKSYTRNLTLYQHVRVKHEKKFVYYCSACSMYQINIATLSRHMYNYHLDLCSFLCRYCDYRAYNLATLKGHVKRKHPGCSFINLKTDFSPSSIAEPFILRLQPQLEKDGKSSVNMVLGSSSPTLKESLIQKEKQKMINTPIFTPPPSTSHLKKQLDYPLISLEDEDENNYSNPIANISKNNENHTSKLQPSVCLSSSEGLRLLLKKTRMRKYRRRNQFPLNSDGNNTNTSFENYQNPEDTDTVLMENIANNNYIEIKSVVCPLCIFEGKTLTNLKKHLIEKHRKYPYYSCSKENCNYKSRYRNNVEHHTMKMHNMIFYIQCPHCPSSLAEMGLLYQHIKSHHVKAGTSGTNHNEHKPHHNNQYTCCNISFLDKEELNNHMYANASSHIMYL